ncbi:MAG: histidine phosphatase family protein [Candidatus Burarchaeum sp.]|nr:histidine phosphatase family protein [Candidatus Burarchaeum sp.]MDO8340157.1 histidine phosphatase family protein [Candidatus Burarchaeum sp.]
MNAQGGVRLWLGRHGETDKNKGANGNGCDKFQSGWSSNLTATGKAQMHDMSEFFIKQAPPDGKVKIICSTTRRAWDSATIFSTGLFEANIEVIMQQDPRVRERDIGKKLDGKKVPVRLSEEQIEQDFKKHKRGEPREAVLSRVGNFYGELKRTPEALCEDAGTLVIISHNFAITAFVGMCLGLDWESSLKKLSFDNGSVTLGYAVPGNICIFEDAMNLTHPFSMPEPVRKLWVPEANLEVS